MAKSSKYSWKERLNVEELYNTFIGFAPREQILVGVGIGVVLLLLVLVPVSCGSSKLTKLEKQIESHEKNVSKVVDKITELQQVQGKMKSVETRIRPKSQVQLTTKLEALATQSGIGPNIDSLKEVPGTPGEDFEEMVVGVRLSRLSLSQLIEFLYGIESQNDLSLQVKRLQLKPRYDNRQQFDANFEVSTFVSNSAPAEAAPGGGG
ncbi:MAG: type II secretion system protein M [Deltaproteobacteria bacterium]|nr:type II secretion system protein M [Deltaproteobacteria bacterium]